MQNTINKNICPVRLFNKLIAKRTSAITTNRLFLSCNRFWTKNSKKPWYKNSPLGRNEISKWTKNAAKKVGLDTKRIKISNHSNRATAVSNLSFHGVEEQELIKITGHSNASSIKPYLQLNPDHHLNIIEKMRNIHSEQILASSSTLAPSATTTITSNSAAATTLSNENLPPGEVKQESKDSTYSVIYQNCNFFTNCSNFRPA